MRFGKCSTICRTPNAQAGAGRSDTDRDRARHASDGCAVDFGFHVPETYGESARSEHGWAVRVRYNFFETLNSFFQIL